MSKKEVKYEDIFLILAIIILLTGFLLLTSPIKTPTGMTHKPSHDPGGGGAGGGGGGGAGGGGDTGTGTTATTTESGGGGGIQKVVGIIARGPENFDTLKRGVQSFLTQVYKH